jgi:nicotinamidase-related amidase
MSLSSTDKGVANIDRQDLLNNMLVLAKAAKLFRVPVILTAVESEEGEASMNTRPSMDMFHTCSRRPGSETVMGIGMALLEHTHYDPQNGAPINSNLADYMVAVNADVPPIDVHFLDFPD